MSASANILEITNCQRGRRLDTAGIRRLVAAVLGAAGQTAELGIHFIGARRSAELNARFLRHDGPTDIITFDHGSTPQRLHGELFICVPEAVRQAREFGTTWPEELRRYVIHGLLHLRGHEDLEPAKRRVMKREENRLVARFGGARPAPIPGARKARHRPPE